MAHLLETTVTAVRRRARWVLVLYGIGWVVAAAVAAVVVLGLTDFLIRFQDQGIRVICSGLLVAAVVYALWRYLVRPLMRNLGDVEIAQRVERSFPALGERFSSSIEFLKQPENDPTAGSAALRRAVIAKASAQLDDIDLTGLLDWRPARRALSVAAGVCIVAAALIALDTSSAQIALVRLVNPISSVQWPRVNDLAFRDPPQRIASGQPFEVELVDRKENLPRVVRIHYRYQTDGVWGDEEVAAMQFTDGAMVAHRENVTRPFQYRAEGGDDDSMSWITLDVVEPPRVDSFEVTLFPPEYTGFKPAKGEKRIRALVGTQVEIRGVASKPLAQQDAVQLQLHSGETIAAQLADDRIHFTIPAESFKVKHSGEYWFALIDDEGLTGGAESRWEVRALADTPPTVSIEQPPTNIFVTPDAVVPLRILAKDNLAVRDVSLRYSRSDRSDQGEVSVPIYTGPEKVVVADDVTPLSEQQSGQRLELEHGWDLSQLELAPGTQIALLAHATDYVPQEGQSASSRRITIITKAELQDRLSQRQAMILAELARVLKMQRESRGQISALEIQLNQVGQLAKEDLDDLQAAELNQRQVDRTLTSPSEGIPAQIAGLLADLESNNVDSPDIERRMNELLSEIARLKRDWLPRIAASLTASLKSAQVDLEENRKNGPNVGQSLDEAGQGQDQVIETLERLLGDLSQWADYRRFAREIRQVRRDQQEIQSGTVEVGEKTLSRDLVDLSPQEVAALRKLAGKQFELARRFDKILHGMQQKREELTEDDPLAAATLEDAVEAARGQGISGQMNTSGRSLEQNRTGEASERQADVGKKLDELLDILANRREYELSRLVTKLREAEQDLTDLRRRQAGLRKKFEAAKDNPNEEERRRELERLVRRQRELQKEIERLARRLERLQADRASRSAGRGAEKLGGAGDKGQSGDAGGAAEQSKAAEKDLDEAQQQLEQARKQAEADLAQEQLAQFADAVRSMVERQQRLLDQTGELENHRQLEGQFRRSQIQTLGDLARAQELLKEEIREHAAKMDDVGVFKLALDETAIDMARAESLLRKRETGASTQLSQRDALARLRQMLKAFENDGDDKEGDSGGAGGSGGQGNQPTRDIAELKLLKLLQEEVNRLTRAVEDELAGTPEPTPEQRGRYERLSREQGLLADLVFDLMQTDKTSDDEPENLPDLRKDGQLDPLDDPLPEFDLESAR